MNVFRELKNTLEVKMDNENSILIEIEKNSELIKRFGVRRLGLFGSYARGDTNESSDLDFVVEFEKKSFDAYMDLKFFLEELFQRRVDLVISDAIRPQLRPIIMKEVIYAKGI